MSFIKMVKWTNSRTDPCYIHPFWRSTTDSWAVCRFFWFKDRQLKQVTTRIYLCSMKPLSSKGRQYHRKGWKKGNQSSTRNQKPAVWRTSKNIRPQTIHFKLSKLIVIKLKNYFNNHVIMVMLCFLVNKKI